MIREINVWLDVRKVTNDSCCEVACEHYCSPSYDVLWGQTFFKIHIEEEGKAEDQARLPWLTGVTCHRKYRTDAIHNSYYQKFHSKGES